MIFGVKKGRCRVVDMTILPWIIAGILGWSCMAGVKWGSMKLHAILLLKVKSNKTQGIEGVYIRIVMMVLG